MRFAVAAAALAGAVMAAEPTATEYTTQYFTVTDCAPTKTDCPADATMVTSTVLPLTTSTIYTTKVHTITSCPPAVPHCPAASTVVVTETESIGVTVCPVEPTHTGYPNSTYVAPPHSSASPPAGHPEPTVTPEPECPTHSVKTIHTSYTTVIPTVIYETVEVPCPTPSAPSHSAPGNGSHPTPTKTPVPTAGAATIGSSVVLAGLGLVAMIFA